MDETEIRALRKRWKGGSLRSLRRLIEGVLTARYGRAAALREEAMENLVFIDVEASGLHRTSYPIEVGWASWDLRSEGFLIRPAADWNEWDWSVQSERVHGIRREECVRHGLDVWDAARRLNAEFAGKTLLSDAPGFDARWLEVLFDATGLEPAFELYLIDALQPIRSALADRGLDERDLEELERRVKARSPRTHRAAADALYLAALYRAATEPGFLQDSL